MEKGAASALGDMMLCIRVSVQDRSLRAARREVNKRDIGGWGGVVGCTGAGVFGMLLSEDYVPVWLVLVMRCYP
jgi:hypothetical protein